MSTPILTYTEQTDVAAACTELLLEHTNDLISLHDPSGIGTYRYASSSFQTMLGYDPARLIGQDGTALVHPDDLELVHEQWASLNTDSTTQATIRYQHADASLRWVEMRWSRFRQRNRSSIIAVGRDVTAYKHLETRFNQIQKLNSIGRLAAGVAHDFHNVMTGINGYAALALLALPAQSDVRGDLEEIQRSTARATTLTNQLLAFARREIGTPASINLNDVICDIGRLLRRVVGEDIELVVLPAAEYGLVNVDAGQIEQVLMNLAVNARDAMPFGGQLTIETHNVRLEHVVDHECLEVPPGSYLLLKISDTGIGMDAGTLQHIFEPFFTTKKAGHGTGLGLAICNEIIKQHGGHIRTSSEPGERTCFTMKDIARVLYSRDVFLRGECMFVDRTDELAMLQQLLNRQRSELLLLFGRRRVGKTALLRHWAGQSSLPWTYWMAQKEPAELQRRKLYAAIRGRAATSTAPTFASWSELWDDVAALIRDDRRILVLDELPWAIEALLGCGQASQ